MSRSIFIAIAAAIVGALIVVFYNILIPPPPATMMGAAAKCGGSGGPPCAITITVYGNCGDASYIAANPDPQPVDKRGNNPNIDWEINTANPGYKFAANGIDFHGDPQFTNGQQQGPTKFRWMDKNSDDKYHKYAINLLRPDGSACALKDPGIVNGQ